MKKINSSYARYTDEELMRQITDGQVNAFNELYKRYSSRLLWYFCRMLGHEQEKAQDFLQDLFMKVVEHPERFDTKRRFSTWIFSCAHNMCKNEYRKLKVRQIIDKDGDVEVARGDLPQVDIDLKTFTSKLYEELDTVEEDHRTAFLLRYREGFSIKEIGEALNCPEGTVKSRLFYTTRKLSKRLSIYNPNQINGHENTARS